MDPQTLQLMLAAMSQMGQLGQQPQRPGMPPTPIAPPTMKPVTNVPTDQGILSHSPGGPEALDTAAPGAGAAAPMAAGAPAADPMAESPLAGISKLGAAVSADDTALGHALLGTEGANLETAAPVAAGATPTAPPAFPATPAENTVIGGMETGGPGDPAAAAAAGGANINKLLSGLQGVKAPPPVTPLMHGGNVGGVKPPEVTAKMGAATSQVPALLQMLFASGGPRGLPVPALGSLLRGA